MSARTSFRTVEYVLKGDGFLANNKHIWQAFEQQLWYLDQWSLSTIHLDISGAHFMRRVESLIYVNFPVEHLKAHGEDELGMYGTQIASHILQLHFVDLACSPERDFRRGHCVTLFLNPKEDSRMLVFLQMILVWSSSTDFFQTCTRRRILKCLGNCNFYTAVCTVTAMIKERTSTLNLTSTMQKIIVQVTGFYSDDNVKSAATTRGQLSGAAVFGKSKRQTVRGTAVLVVRPNCLPCDTGWN